MLRFGTTVNLVRSISSRKTAVLFSRYSAVAPSNALAESIGKSEIVVFRRDHCSYCDDAVSSLISSGYKNQMTVFTVNSHQKEEIIGITKSRSLPSVWVKGKYIGGCNDGPEPWMGVKKLLANGKFIDLLV